MFFRKNILFHAWSNRGEFGKTERKGKMNSGRSSYPFCAVYFPQLLVFLEKSFSKRGTIVFVNELPRGTFEDGVNAGVQNESKNCLIRKKAKQVLPPLMNLTGFW